MLNLFAVYTVMKTIAFSITYKCEDTCAYCFRLPQRDTTLKEFQSLLSRALRDNPELSKVVITGGNPELNPDFWKICGEVKAKKLKLKIHSNYFNKKTWPKYAKIGDEFSVPLDSFESAQFRSEKSVKNYLSVMDYFIKKGKKVQVHTVVGRGNLHELPEIYNFLKEKGFFPNGTNSWKIFKLIGVNNLKEHEITDKEWFEVKKVFSQNRNIKFVDNVTEY